MSEANNTPFGANDSMLGVAYQKLYGLYMLLDNPSPNALMFIEKLDDLELTENNTGNTTITQVKYKKGSLTDGSDDFWETIRIWAYLISNNRIVNPNDTLFLFLTTQMLGKKSTIILNLLKNDRDCSTIREAMKKKANEKKKKEDTKKTNTKDNNTNENLSSGFTYFLKLSESQQDFLIKNIRIQLNEIDIEKLKEKIIHKICYLETNIEDDSIDFVYSNITGWWENACIKQLKMKDSATGICSKELRDILRKQASQYDKKTLTIYDEIENSEADDQNYNDYDFVKQFGFIKLGNASKHNAIQDFYKAFAHRTKWLADSILFEDDDQRYHNDLIDEWKVRYDNMTDEMDASVVENIDAIKTQKGKELYNQFCMEHPEIHLKGLKKAYIVRGSYHILANDHKVGWHPDYKKLLNTK